MTPEGAYLRLIEYNNHEGFVLASSMTNKRVKNVRQYLKMGQDDFMNVFTVDKKGGGGHAFIDLSKKNVQMDDIDSKKKYFDKSKVVHLIMRLTAA